LGCSWRKTLCRGERRGNERLRSPTGGVGPFRQSKGDFGVIKNHWPTGIRGGSLHGLSHPGRRTLAKMRGKKRTGCLFAHSRLKRALAGPKGGEESYRRQFEDQRRRKNSSTGNHDLKEPRENYVEVSIVQQKEYIQDDRSITQELGRVEPSGRGREGRISD